MAWTDLTFPFGSILTSSKMTNFYNNLVGTRDNSQLYGGYVTYGNVEQTQLTFESTTNTSFVSPPGTFVYIYYNGVGTTCNFRFDQYAISGGTSTAKVTFGSTDSAEFTETAASFNEKTGTIDISGETEGWLTVKIQHKTDNASYESRVRRLAFYISE